MRDWDSFLPIYMHGSNSLAGMNGHGFLALLAGRVTRGFTYNFARICTRLGLGDLLTADELKQLYTAALFATLCSIAFNGLGGCVGRSSRSWNCRVSFWSEILWRPRPIFWQHPGGGH